MGLGRALYECGRYEEAKSAYMDARSIDPSGLEALAELKLAESRAGKRAGSGHS